MFGHALTELSLSASRQAAAPRPSYRPTAEVLEERIVLSGAPARPAILAERAQALAAVDPSTAIQQVVNTIAATLQQSGLLQQQLLTLATRMGQRPPGGARQGSVNRAVALVNRFAKQEKKRFKQFLALEHATTGSPDFTTFAQMYQQIHQGSLMVKNKVPSAFRLLSRATFRPSASSRASQVSTAKTLRQARRSLSIRADAASSDRLSEGLTYLAEAFFGGFGPDLHNLAVTQSTCAAYEGASHLAVVGDFIDIYQAVLSTLQPQLTTADYNNLVGLINGIVDLYNTAIHRVKAVLAANPPIVHP
jgi:hypothetical protein